MHSNKINLYWYSAFASCFLLLNKEAKAEAVYTDIIPDAELDFNFETVDIDMDNNGIAEFHFWRISGSYYYLDTLEGSYYYRSHRLLWVGPLNNFANEIAGDYHTNGAGGGTTYLPYKLDYGMTIKNILNFQSADDQLMVAGHMNLDIGIWHLDVGEWMFSTEDKYIGVRFKGDDDCMHFGWIRCSVQDDMSKLIIKDYAYESKCLTGILAGDTIGDTSNLSIDNANTLDATVYSFGSTIYLRINENNNAAISIYDISGKNIYATTATPGSNEIKLNVSSGYYFVEIVSADKKFRKKVFIY